MEKAKQKNVNLYLPSDCIVADEFKYEANIEHCDINDIKDGWDGTSKGKPMSQGTYVYFIDFTNPDGTTYHKKGTVLLIR